jgi:hypothetical protein
MPTSAKRIALAYLDARDVQDRLTDAVCGIGELAGSPFPWSVANGKIACDLPASRIRVNGDRWIWKGDGAGAVGRRGGKRRLQRCVQARGCPLGRGDDTSTISTAPWVEIEPAGKSFKIADNRSSPSCGKSWCALLAAKTMPRQAPAESLPPHARRDTDTPKAGCRRLQGYGAVQGGWGRQDGRPPVISCSARPRARTNWMRS